MPLIPTREALDITAANLAIAENPTHTYYWDIYRGRIRGYTDGLEAMRQTIHHILFTERYAWPIYSHNYGIELADLFGKPVTYCIPKIKMRVTEALAWDDRIIDVTDWRFETEYSTVKTWFVVVTIFDNIPAELEVPI